MTIYRPAYSGSHALVVGINVYAKASPLQHARSDAEAIAEQLLDRFGFLDSSVIRLFDADATREAILDSYLALAREGTKPDDRLVVYFAGHGHTETGLRGEVGYLVPHDGSDERLTSLIRWDELVHNTELIKAKHIFFIMDACYGGLVLRRGLKPGSSRLIRDMLTRRVRQALTAGKADEQVSDAGGPRPNHSLFTGHLLDGLEGGASMGDGVITANGLMSYVYQRVGKDMGSQQTPHHGFLDGDGDFIFSPISEQEPQQKGNDNQFVEVPAVVVPPPSASDEIIARVKDYIPDPTKAIALDDLLVAETRRVLALLGSDRFPAMDADFSAENVAARLHDYEDSVAPLCSGLAVIGHWGDTLHRSLPQKILVRLIERVFVPEGLQGWLALRYYPCMLATYCFGIAAMSAERYELLQPLLYAPVAPPKTGRQEDRPFIVALTNGVFDIERTEMFKKLPEHKRHYAARSEYMFKLLQPQLDDLMFLGQAYESVFDSFEVFTALVCADAWNKPRGLLGRYGWKYKGWLGETNPFDELVKQAKSQGQKWPPIAAGFFGGSTNRFEEVAAMFRGVLERLNWH